MPFKCNQLLYDIATLIKSSDDNDKIPEGLKDKLQAYLGQGNDINEIIGPGATVGFGQTTLLQIGVEANNLAVVSLLVLNEGSKVNYSPHDRKDRSPLFLQTTTQPKKERQALNKGRP